jgi:predicted transglutaminase-like cysteine proteinase
MRPLHLWLALAGTAIVAYASHDLQWLTDSRMWMHSVVTNEAGRFESGEVEGRLASQVNDSRQKVQQGKLERDDDLRLWIDQQLEKNAVKDLQGFTESAQARFPRYSRLAVCNLQSLSLGEMMQKTADWTKHTENKFTHLAIVARKRPARLGFECVIVAGRRLEDFRPEDLVIGHDQFYVTCPLCHHSQTCEVPPLMRTISLECPNCRRPYAMLAVDTKGRYHYVNEYLTGYCPPAHFPAGISRLNEMLLIWDSVIHAVRYLPDSADGNEQNDAWQTAPETQQLGTGDCEDSSIYLADWLIARGFEARVALGHLAERGGHAWVVVRLEGNTYLLEATNPDANTSRPPLLSDVGSRYVPDASLDREGFYVRTQPSATWDGDYWTNGKWQYVIPERKKSVASVKTTDQRFPKQ